MFLRETVATYKGFNTYGNSIVFCLAGVQHCVVVLVARQFLRLDSRRGDILRIQPRFRQVADLHSCKRQRLAEIFPRVGEKNLPTGNFLWFLCSTYGIIAQWLVSYCSAGGFPATYARPPKIFFRKGEPMKKLMAFVMIVSIGMFCSLGCTKQPPPQQPPQPPVPVESDTPDQPPADTPAEPGDTPAAEMPAEPAPEKPGDMPAE